MEEVAVNLALDFLNKSANKETQEDENGRFTLRLNRLYQIVGLIYIAIGFFVLFMILYFMDPAIIIIGLIMIGVFWGMGIPCLIWYYNHKLTFDKKNITVKSWTTKEETIDWLDIEDIAFKRWSGYIKLAGKNKRMTIHSHLVGLKSFIRMMEKKTKWRAKDLKLPIQ